MVDNPKFFLKSYYNIDTDSLSEKEVRKKLIDIIKRNNQLIQLKNTKNKMLLEEIERLSA